jgi:hypothetical protein
MKNRFLASFLLAGALLVPISASAAPVKAFISPVTVAPQESAGLREALQRLLASRLSGDGISTVDSAAEAEVIINASYTQIGKVFSVDAAAKTAAGETIASAFEQGEGQDGLIPAVGKVSAKLKADTLKRYAPAHPAPAPVLQAAPAALAAPASVAQPRVAVPHQEPGSTLWLSQRIAGAQTSMAPAGSVAGARMIFLAEGHKLAVYRQDGKLAAVAEAELPQREKILAVDCTGREGEDGVRAYVTIIDDDTPSSRIYSFQNGKLKLVSEKLPYMFRGVALNGGAAKIYAQQMGRIDDYYGDVFEVSDKGGKLELKNPIKMPHFANIFNFNMFSDAAGKSYFTVFSNDGYLIVYSDSGEELYRSEDKYGGSETYFQRQEQSTARPGEDNIRWRFLQQRITVTGKGEIIVPQNDGFFVVGHQRSYTKHSVSCLTWNGSSLEERWKTKVSPNYLADYFQAPGSNELVLLEVVQKAGIFGRGGSAVRVVSGSQTVPELTATVAQ